MWSVTPLSMGYAKQLLSKEYDMERGKNKRNFMMEKPDKYNFR